MIVEKEYMVRSSEIGKDNKVTDKVILNYLEDIAAIHSSKAGNGILDMPITHISWIILEWKLNVIRRPNYLEKINVKTWIRGIVKFYSYRDFEIYDENNNLIIIASSKWITIDTIKGKITRLSEQAIEKYGIEQDKNVFKDNNFEKIAIPEKFENEAQYVVRRSDIDLNNHMHNLNYIDLAIEALPKEVISNGVLFDNLRITYKKEIKLGETVKCKYSFRDNKNIVIVKDFDEKIIHAVIELY